MVELPELPEKFILKNSECPSIIYHYCSFDTFKKIVESKCLWLTSIDQMNDYTEGSWVTRIVKRLCRTLSMEQSWGDEDKLRITSFIQNIDANVRTRLGYLCCFSEEKDLLSQWRTYADNGKGIAIGFSQSRLQRSLLQHFPRTFPNNEGFLSGIGKVHYVDHNDQGLDNWLRKIVDQVRSDPKDGACVKAAEKLSAFSLLFKNPGFKEEKEWRIAIMPERQDLRNPGLRDKELEKKLHLRETKSGISHFFKLPIEQESNIVDIVLGPCSKLSPNDVTGCLRNKLGRRIRVWRSSVTLRCE